MEFKEYSVPIRIHNDGPKAWKQYRRGGRLFWRNYRRDVPGGITFIDRLDGIAQTTYRAMLAKLSEQIFKPVGVI